jgi:hypothetical protein
VADPSAAPASDPASELHDDYNEGFLATDDNYSSVGTLNSPDTAMQLSKLLYPEVIGNHYLPKEIDILIFFTFRAPRALCPISSVLLIEALEFLVTFLEQREGAPYLSIFLQQIHSQLSTYGWPTEQTEV